MTERDRVDKVHGRMGGVSYNVKFDGALAGGMDLVGNARLESGVNMIDISVHRADAVRRERKSDETAYAFVLLLTLNPDEITEAEDERTEDGRVA